MGRSEGYAGRYCVGRYYVCEECLRVLPLRQPEDNVPEEGLAVCGRVTDPADGKLRGESDVDEPPKRWCEMR